MAVGTFAFLNWTAGIPTVEFLTKFAAFIPSIGYGFPGTKEGRNIFGGSVYGAQVGRNFDDPVSGLPHEPPGLGAMGATVMDERGNQAFMLSLSSESGLVELFVGGKVQVVTLRMSGHMHPGYFRDDLDFMIRQYELLKHLHSGLSADQTWAIDYGQDICNTGPGYESLQKAACWFSREGPQKLIKPLEERRMPLRAQHPGEHDDFEICRATGLPNWALVVHR
jgi:hypothetical protein